MTDPTIKEIITAIAERRRQILPIRVYNVLNALDRERDGINQAFKWIVDLLSGKCIVFSGQIGNGKTISAAFMACYWTWCASCKPVYDGLRADSTIKADNLTVLGEAINASIHHARFKWAQAEEVMKLEWHELDSGYEGLLIIDDMGREYMKPESDFGPRRWDELIDVRYRDYLPTIITTNLTVKEFEDRYGKRNRSRLREWGIWIEIAEEDMR